MEEYPRSFIEIPSSDRATALEFVLDSLRDAIRDPACSQLQFTSATVNLRDLWHDMEPKLKGWSPEVRLSRVSPCFLTVRIISERHIVMTNQLAAVLTVETRSTGVETNISKVMPPVGDSGVEEEYAADVALCFGGQPSIWCEIVDGQRYKDVVEKLMLISASCPSVYNFILIHLYPTGGDGGLTRSDRAFTFDFQLFASTVRRSYADPGRFSTRKFRSDRYDIAVSDRPRNEVPQDRTSKQHFDLIQTSLFTYQFTDTAENPVYRLFTDDVPVSRLGDDPDLLSTYYVSVLGINMWSFLKVLQRHRDMFAANAAKAQGKEFERFDSRRVNYSIEPAENSTQVPSYLYKVLHYRTGRRHKKQKTRRTEETPQE